MLSNQPEAKALETARNLGLNAVSLPSKGIDSETYAAQVCDVLARLGIDLICLAGFMRRVGQPLRGGLRGTHSEYPPFAAAVLSGLARPAAGARLRGAVLGLHVHFVEAGIDSGPIITQAAVPVLDDDTADTLAARILVEEHKIYSASHRACAERALPDRGPARDPHGLMRDMRRFNGRIRSQCRAHRAPVPHPPRQPHAVQELQQRDGVLARDSRPILELGHRELSAAVRFQKLLQPRDRLGVIDQLRRDAHQPALLQAAFAESASRAARQARTWPELPTRPAPPARLLETATRSSSGPRLRRSANSHGSSRGGANRLRRRSRARLPGPPPTGVRATPPRPGQARSKRVPLMELGELEMQIAAASAMRAAGESGAGSAPRSAARPALREAASSPRQHARAGHGFAERDAIR